MPKAKPKKKLVIRGIDSTQRAELGGSPIHNEIAARLDLGHGTPLLILSKRDLVAFLKRVQLLLWVHETHLGVLDTDVGKVNPRVTLKEIEDLLEEWDTFVEPVKATENHNG